MNLESIGLTILQVRKGGELLSSKEEGGKISSKYFIKYLSRLIMLKMYEKCADTSLAHFLMIEMLNHCLA